MSNNSENIPKETVDDWDIALVWHDGMHEKKLSIAKNCRYRHTYCIQCDKGVMFERKDDIDPQTGERKRYTYE